MIVNIDNILYWIEGFFVYEDTETKEGYAAILLNKLIVTKTPHKKHLFCYAVMKSNEKVVIQAFSKLNKPLKTRSACSITCIATKEKMVHNHQGIENLYFIDRLI